MRFDSWETTIFGIAVIVVAGGLIMIGAVWQNETVLGAGLALLTLLTGGGLIAARSQRQHEKDKKE